MAFEVALHLFIVMISHYLTHLVSPCHSHAFDYWKLHYTRRGWLSSKVQVFLISGLE